MTHLTSVFVAATFVACLAPGPVLAAETAGVRLVLRGHDPVAYFTEHKPVKGSAKFAYEWDEGRYHFASAKHREMFAGDPERYAPQFGGYCTGSMSRGVRKEGDPAAWVIQDGKLYVFGEPTWKSVAENDPNFIPSRLERARKNYRPAN